ncbi:hypothetical protein [Streptomyces sp. NPDC050504]|uniref:hypothetical protein n=1 Tax=Streptomyces sp. NPDC050504 TaxID=3365618 RepID=UPI00378A5E76
MNRSDGRLPADRRVRRHVLALAVGSVLLCAIGATTDSMWLLGIGTWLLIAAVLLELVYRP